MIVHNNQPADEQDWATIQDAMRTALTIVEGQEHEWHFLQLLVLILENKAGWPPDDPNTGLGRSGQLRPLPDHPP